MRAALPYPRLPRMAASDHPEPNHRGETTKVRVLVAFEDARGVYREAIARAMGELRPDLEVRPAPLAEIDRELRGFDPHVVVCSRRNGKPPGGRGAWVQVPTDDEADDEERLARLCLDGERWDTEGPTLGEILAERGRDAPAPSRGAPDRGLLIGGPTRPTGARDRSSSPRPRPGGRAPRLSPTGARPCPAPRRPPPQAPRRGRGRSSARPPSSAGTTP